MRKRVLVNNDNFYNIGNGISTITYQEGKPFPSNWKWLSRVLTDWTTVSRYLINGIPTNEMLRGQYGKDVEIRNPWRDENDKIV